ncbi:hypothetical protein GBA65_21635 (plasmid) [Rubrobacter marinus]|uniref:Uncharacterized protein n=1 Tax=Rubrobacter marinus TaxID=2653852 RepID=A0A6G8Q3L3_9ACTN|nr:hypothetical protein GBA65_21635 [Rubrobacter marinus]
MPGLVDRYWEWRRRCALRAPELQRDSAAFLERLGSPRDARSASAVPISRPKGGRSAAEDHNYARLLAVTDGSGPSLRAGEHAVYLAKNLGAELFVLGSSTSTWRSARASATAGSWWSWNGRAQQPSAT